jgi:hypothetical protein
MAVISLFAELIDQYKIEQHLAQKSYTDLYLGFDVDENRQVVLDVLRPEYAHNEEFARRFTNRAKSIAQIKHPNIAQIYQVGRTADNLPYVAQAHIDGYTLSQRLEQLANQGAPVNSIYALKLIRQLAEALTLADRLDMVHYELQPAHVLLKNVTQQTDDVVLLRDLFIPFNLDTNLAASEKALPYLSPEQREGREADATGHVYSLGVILYEILVGRPPARPVRLWEPALRGLTAGTTMLQRERDDLAAETYNLIDRCLRREPRRRFQNSREFVIALDNALAAERLRVASSPKQMDHGARRPWTVILALLFLGLVLVASLALLRGNNPPRPTIEPTTTILAGVGSTNVDLTAVAPSPTSAAYPYPGAELTAEARGALPGVPTDTQTPTPSASPTVGASNGTSTGTPTAESGTPRATATATTIVIPRATATETPTPQPAVRVVVPSASLRTGPGTDYRILGFLVEDEVVRVLAWNGEEESPWYVVWTNDDRVGWLAASTTEPVTPAIEDNPLIVDGVPPAATIPAAPPTPTLTPTPTGTASPTPTVTLVPPVPDPGDDGDDGGEIDPPSTAPPDEPTPTVPPFPTSSP